MESKKGFTLAEVLITLGVIGVVSAITMPTLINNFQVSSWESSLKKSYATITNGFHAIASEHDGDLRNSGIFDDVDDVTFSDKIDEAVKKHFNVIKSCKIGENDCADYSIKCLANSSHAGCRTYNWFGSGTNRYVAYLNDGTILSISNIKCVPTTYQDKSVIKYNCASIIVDTNGLKSPNVRGKDIFQFGILDDRGNIYPPTSLEWVKANKNTNNPLEDNDYWRNSNWQCGTSNTKLKDETITVAIVGENCLARIMDNGWQMDYLK